MPKINHSSDRIDRPTIYLTGRRITDGAYTHNNVEYTVTQDILKEEGRTITAWRNQDPIAFQGNVYVTINSDPDYIATDYSSRTTTDFTGVNNNPGLIGGRAETYYTLNGKDPVRTKSNLYIGQFVIRRNESGSDNTILKARTYFNGKTSEVTKVEIRVNRANANAV